MARMLRSLAMLALLALLTASGCGSRRQYERPTWSNTGYTSGPSDGGLLQGTAQGLSDASMSGWNFRSGGSR